jgi:hypothetical protein
MSVKDVLGITSLTAGSMGGESNKSIVQVFVVVEGVGKDVCCGLVGSNGSRFCTSVPNECTFKSHIEKKVHAKLSHVH